jgi:hypothetical protein
MSRHTHIPPNPNYSRSSQSPNPSSSNSKPPKPEKKTLNDFKPLKVVCTVYRKTLHSLSAVGNSLAAAKYPASCQARISPRPSPLEPVPTAFIHPADPSLPRSLPPVHHPLLGTSPSHPPVAVVHPHSRHHPLHQVTHLRDRIQSRNVVPRQDRGSAGLPRQSRPSIANTDHRHRRLPRHARRMRV